MRYALCRVGGSSPSRRLAGALAAAAAVAVAVGVLAVPAGAVPSAHEAARAAAAAATAAGEQPAPAGVSVDAVPGAAVLRSGVALVAWTAVNRGQRILVVARRSSPARPWASRPVEIEAPEATLPLSPRLVPLGGSRVALLLSLPGAGGAVLRISEDEGLSWRPPVGSLAGATPIAAAAAAAGRVVVAWGGGEGLRAGALPIRAGATAGGTETLLDDGCCVPLAGLAVDGQGRAHVVWQARARTGSETRYAYLGREGRLLHRLTLARGTPAGADVAAFGRTAAVAYLERRGAAVDVRLSAMKSGARSDTRTVGTGNSAGDRPVRVVTALGPSGQLWVVWVSERGLIKARRAKRAGSFELGRTVTSRVRAQGVGGLVALPDANGVTVVVSTGRRAGSWTYRRARLALPA